MSQFRDEHHILFIDPQASFDLAYGALLEGHTWEALRDALQRVAAYGWPGSELLQARPRTGMSLTHRA